MTAATVATRPIARWLSDVLSGDATIQALAPGGVHERRLPQPVQGQVQAFPAVIFQYMSGLDVRPSGHEYVWANCIYLVKAIDKKSTADDIEGLAQQITLLLDNQDGVPAGGQVFTCQRRTLVDYGEVAAGGAVFQHLGGTYAIEAR